MVRKKVMREREATTSIRTEFKLRTAPPPRARAELKRIARMSSDNKRHAGNAPTKKIMTLRRAKQKTKVYSKP